MSSTAATTAAIAGPHRGQAGWTLALGAEPQ